MLPIMRFLQHIGFLQLIGVLFLGLIRLRNLYGHICLLLLNLRPAKIKVCIRLLVVIDGLLRITVCLLIVALGAFQTGQLTAQVLLECGSFRQRLFALISQVFREQRNLLQYLCLQVLSHRFPLTSKVICFF